MHHLSNHSKASFAFSIDAHKDVVLTIRLQKISIRVVHEADNVASGGKRSTARRKRQRVMEIVRQCSLRVVTTERPYGRASGICICTHKQTHTHDLNEHVRGKTRARSRWRRAASSPTITPRAFLSHCSMTAIHTGGFIGRRYQMPRSWMHTQTSGGALQTHKHMQTHIGR